MRLTGILFHHARQGRFVCSWVFKRIVLSSQTGQALPVWFCLCWANTGQGGCGHRRHHFLEHVWDHQINVACCGKKKKIQWRWVNTLTHLCKCACTQTHTRKDKKKIGQKQQWSSSFWAKSRKCFSLVSLHMTNNNNPVLRTSNHACMHVPVLVCPPSYLIWVIALCTLSDWFLNKSI